MCRNGPRISHLFFANDTLLFCRASRGDLEAILQLLQLYEQASGQKLNREKTMVFFSKGTTEERRRELKEFLGVNEIREYEKYLALPDVVGRNKKESLNYIRERVWNKLQGWKERLLSKAGKKVLLKAVVQAIPTFAMSCFKLPKGLIQDINRLIRKLWWGQQGDQRKIHWKDWETLCKLKTLGGMGFKDLEKFNEVMLAKQVWRLLTDHTSLFYRVFSSKYFPNGSILDAKPSSGSYAWQSIVKAIPLIKSSMLWRVGDGKQIKIFGERWLPGEEPAKVISPSSSIIVDWTVSMLLDPNGVGWNDQLVDAMFLPFEAQRIKGIPICVASQEDCVVWPKFRSRSYSVRLGNQLLCEAEATGAPSRSTDEGVKRF